ncbi:DUF3875 domain-containing protein, partial [Bacteroides uniformis]|uniref:DUF3875 domain-containing protein n=1 Tax=Bacteroides uniformis TaxID=820 RepID=UPI00321A2CA4
MGAYETPRAAQPSPLHHQPEEVPSVDFSNLKKRKSMRNVMKTATLESKFPLLSVEHGCIVSKDADITVAYRVELPELFTLTKAEYEAVHST